VTDGQNQEMQFAPKCRICSSRS